MSPSLAQKIESLPPEKQAEVEDFVDFLRRKEQSRLVPATFSQQLLDEIRAAREAVGRQQPIPDADAILRDLREHGGR